MNAVKAFSSFCITILFLIYYAEGKPAEIYHHYIQRADCDHKDETDINLSQMVVKEYNVEETDTFNVDDCLKCSIDEDYERGINGGYISCTCVKKDEGIVLGDIRVDDRNREFMNYAFGRPTFQRGTISGAKYKWPTDSSNNVIIPYVISGVFLTDSTLSDKFQRAIKVFHENTCIRFVQRTNQANFIRPVDEGGCWSFVGKVGGDQKVSIGHSCVKDGIVVHELMHALGFFHEQSRKDRDRYVRIHLGNVLTGFESNFEVATNIEDTNSPYDYGSVMHYGSYAFSTNSQRTITRNDGGSTSEMGQRDGMSQIDIEEINARYCSRRATGVVNPPTFTKSTPAPRTTATTTTTTTVRPTTKPSPTSCSDYYTTSICIQWEGLGYCEHTFQEFMSKYCKKTCGQCISTPNTAVKVKKTNSACKDKVRGCSTIRQYCSSSFHESWMRAYCESTCGFCMSSETVTTAPTTTTAAPRKISNAACGTTYTSSLYARIVGGTDADAGSIPWQANIRYKDLSVCGGTLIGDRWILTAAHCMIGGPDDYTVLLGLQDRDVTDEAQVQSFRVKKITLHEDYSPISSRSPMLNDIAVLELDHDVEYTNYVIKACLPSQHWDGRFTQFTASGWGDTAEAGHHSQVLQKVTLSLISQTKCENWLGQSGFSIDPNAICAGDETGGKDSCQGDSGGPLTAVSFGRNYLMAVVSWGIGCGREKHPGVYTKVIPHLDWIKNVMGET